MSKDKNVFFFPGGEGKKPTKEMNRMIKEDLDNLIEFTQMMAQLQKAKFDALKKEGFDDAQALELCKTVLGG